MKSFLWRLFWNSYLWNGETLKEVKGFKTAVVKKYNGSLHTIEPLFWKSIKTKTRWRIETRKGKKNA